MIYPAEQVRARFVQEFIRAKAKGLFFTNEEFCKAIGRQRNFMSNLLNPNGTRQTIRSEDLHFAGLLYNFDVRYVLIGGAKAVKAKELPSLKELGNRGKWKREKK